MMHIATHGGARPRSGRKPGSRNKATVEREAILSEAVVRARAAGIANHPPEMTREEIAAMTPVEIISFAMTQAACEGRWADAAGFAAMVAPYRHPKLSSVAVNASVHRSLESMSDAELVAIAAGEIEG